MRFRQVDVFTDRPFLGNPVAVVIGADGLDTAQMQRIACSLFGDPAPLDALERFIESVVA